MAVEGIENSNALEAWVSAMDERSTMAVLVLRPGPMRSSVLTLLSTIPQLQIVAEAKDMAALMQIDLATGPHVALFEAEMAKDGLAQALKQIKVKWPATKIVVLVENQQQYETAEKFGADCVQYKGFRAGKFVEAIGSLLDPAGNHLRKK